MPIALVWPQPLAPVHSVGVSALIAAIPLAVVLVLMGALRRSGLLSSACGLGAAVVLAAGVWRMPLHLIGWSVAFGLLYALWSILWLVFGALWLYNLAVETGSFERLRSWMAQHASSDACVQAIFVAFCFGALLEASAGFGAPVAVTAFLLVGLGMEAQKAVVVSLLANTAPVAFAALGLPIVALAGVTGLDIMKLSATTGQQVAVISFIVPSYLALMIAGRRGLRRSWPAALVAGATFAGVQFFVSNFWGPYATGILSAIASIVVLTLFLRVWRPKGVAEPVAGERHRGDAVTAWVPWVVLSVVMVSWTWLKMFQKGQLALPIPQLHQGVMITLYERAYAAVFSFQPLAAGTAVVFATIITALWFRVTPRAFAASGARTVRQLRLPGVTVLLIVALAYLYNYSGMAYTLGAAVSRAGVMFPILSSYLGWVACFLTGSDTSANVLFGNLQVAAAHQLHLNPVLLAATNSSGGVAGKMISPQNIAIGVTTVGLIGQEGTILRRTFWHSVALAGIVGLIAFVQAYYLPWMVP